MNLLAGLAVLLPMQVYATAMVAGLSGAVAMLATLARRLQRADLARRRAVLAARRQARAAAWSPMLDPWPLATTGAPRSCWCCP